MRTVAAHIVLSYVPRNSPSDLSLPASLRNLIHSLAPIVLGMYVHSALNQQVCYFRLPK